MQINPIGAAIHLNPEPLAIKSGEGAALPISGTAGIGETEPTGKSFGQFLQDAIGEVNQAQIHAGEMTNRFAAGEPLDIHQVMIAGQEANVMLNMAMQVRNKLVDAYQEIMHVSL